MISDDSIIYFGQILDELVNYYNQQRVHEETGEIPAKRWQDAINNGEGKLRPLDTSTDLERYIA